MLKKNNYCDKKNIGMNKPKISVIMPAYNAGKFIVESIESVLNQTYKNFELLIIIDVSNDDTERIVKEYAAKDKRVKLLRNVKEKSVAGAINTGLENACGEYIARADADDINRPYRFEKQLQYLKSHPDIAFLGGGYAPFNENGHRLDIFHPTSSVEITWKFISNSYFCHPTVIFRKEVFETLGGYPNVEAEDFAYFSEVVKKFKCANLPAILIDYRESLSNRSNSVADKIADSVKRQAIKNYAYYAGNKENFELFFEYQNRNRLFSKDLFTIEKNNFKILKKIASDYNQKMLSAEFIGVFIKIIVKDIYKILFK